LIRFYGDKLVAMMGPYLEQQILQSLASQDRWREELTKAFAQPYPTPDQAIKQMVEHFQTLTGQETVGQPTAGKDTPGEPADDEPDKA
jgi:polyhydroxyalkanoate synthesis regulator protein